MEKGSSKSFELLSCYHCYTAALAPESLWCASGAPVLSYSIQPVSFKHISSTFFPSIPFPERKDKTYKRTEVLGFIGIHKRQKRRMQKPLLDWQLQAIHTLPKPEHARPCRKVTSGIPLILIVISHEKAKSPHPTYALSSYCGHGPLA